MEFFIYQEQVMQAAQILAGYSLSSADILRRAMGKKDRKEMEEQKQNFIDGAVHHGLTSEISEDIFEQIAAFTGYGFNKSHAAPMLNFLPMCLVKKLLST